MCIFILSKFFIYSHFQVFYLLPTKPLSRIIGLKGTCILNFGRCYQTPPKWFTISTHSSSGWEFIFSPILSTFHLFLFSIIVVDGLNVLSHIYYLWHIFFCNISFSGFFLPSHFSVGLPFSSFRGSLCILHIPDISLLLDICFRGFWLCFVCLFCLCWLGVSCVRQAFYCSVWASLQLQHARFRALMRLSSCSMGFSCLGACGILVLSPGIGTHPSALKVNS